MLRITLDGSQLTANEGDRLSDILPDHDPALSVAVIRPGTVSQEVTRHFRVVTSAGEFVVEIPDAGVTLPDPDDDATGSAIHWVDRYAAAFGPFPASFSPSRSPSRYARGDLIIGCGGYDPKRSYLILSRKDHQADHGASSDGGIIGRVVAGRAVIDRLTTGDRITAVERMISWADSTHSVTTTDLSMLLEDGMEIVSYIRIRADGYTDESVDPRIARSAEHLLFSCKDGIYHADRTTSTHCMDAHLGRLEVPQEQTRPRHEGAVTVRTKGRNSGAMFIYREDVATSAHHTLVGQVTHGIELIRLIGDGETCAVITEPDRLDLRGMHIGDARALLEERKISFEVMDDMDASDRIITDQEPATTLEVLAAGHVRLTTMREDDVIDIFLDDEKAPKTVDIFRRFTGLKLYSVGMLPFFFTYEDVWLFEPEIPERINIIPENTPVDTIPANSLAMTNASRRGAGLVGVRTSEDDEFGPTGEPLEGTNIIGSVIDVGKLKDFKEGDIVYIREVKR